VHPRNHQAVVQKPELHVLATYRRAGIILLAVAANLFEHLRVDFKPSPLGQEVERLTAVQVVVKLAVRADAGESPPGQQAALPQPAQASVGDILVAGGKPRNLRSRTESVPQDRIEDIEVTVGNRSGPPRPPAG
jgi:hypothetical protein